MSLRRETLLVQQSLPTERLDNYLRREFPMVSRNAIQRLIEQGHITVNGAKVKPTHHPRAGQTIEVVWPEARPAEAQPEEIPLVILYEDDDLLVLNKAAGIVVHPAAGNEEHTLVNALLHHCKGRLSGIGGVARPGIVHRLDKETSGCMVVAKTDAAHTALAEQFGARTIKKIYLAILCGVLPHDSGEIRAAITRHPTHRKRMTTSDGLGREAWTSYKINERLTTATVVEARIHTGRTHQVRVHFQHLGFPVVGDGTYGAKQNQRLAETTGCHAPRVMLHAWRLEFYHPITKKPAPFKAPVPPDFADVIECLRAPRVHPRAEKS